MRYAAIALLLTCSFFPVRAQEKTEGPQDAKAQKTYNEGLEALKQHQQIGDSSVEGKLKKLISRAKELQAKDLQAADKPKQ